MSSHDLFHRAKQIVASRPEISVECLALITSLYFTALCNKPFWTYYGSLVDLSTTKAWLTGLSLGIGVTGLHMGLLCVILARWNAKIVLTALFAVTAFAVYYMNQYTVFIDADMVRNVLHTEPKEAMELVTPGLAWSIVFYAAIPIAVLWRLQLVRRPLGRAAAIRIGTLMAVVAVTAFAILGSFQDVSAMMRNHKSMRYLITPGNVAASLGRVGQDAIEGSGKPRIKVGQDAIAQAAPGDKPKLLVIVVGETVRAANWGLSGYRRNTTPQLQALDVVNFADVTACGTSTEVSLPCMFAARGRRNYDKDAISRSESLLHVFNYAGILTLWRDNQTGCKGVCTGLPFHSYLDARIPEVCEGSRCFDEVLLDGLQNEIEKSDASQVVVLHQLGNHGPSYFSRYPPAFKRFTPACETPQLGDCTSEEIVNAYDNAILYTDHVIAKTIDFLGKQHDRETALIYVSDHGESLGESGLYLHGVPYAIAPDVQLKVPMLLWVSEAMRQSQGLSMDCLNRMAKRPVSHDNLFSTALGLMQVETRVYDKTLDMTARCAITRGWR